METSQFWVIVGLLGTILIAMFAGFAWILRSISKVQDKVIDVSERLYFMEGAASVKHTKIKKVK